MQADPDQRRRNRTLREALFRHLDGFAIAPTMVALESHGVLGLFREQPTWRLADVVERCGGNEGYLQVALRLLCSQGWLVQAVDSRIDEVRYTTTSSTEAALDYVDAYSEVVSALPLLARLRAALFEGCDACEADVLAGLVAGHGRRFGLAPSGDPDVDRVQKQVLLHVEGILAGPLLVALAMEGCLEGVGERVSLELETFGVRPPALEPCRDLAHALAWTEDDGTITESGRFHLTRAAAYGVTVSYLPMFARVDGLLFGDGGQLWNVPAGAPEIHVDRTMNVWGSGGAHAAYFAHIDDIVVALFNRPLEDQPRGVADMGCGNGAFLAHIFDVIWERTERGKVLEEYPLVIVGSDLNDAALEATSHTLERADVWANIVIGDVGDPETLARELESEHGVRLQDLLSVRSFLDHNRLYCDPDRIEPGRESRSTGAFSFRGRRIPNNAIEQNLVDHLREWTPFVSRFGLLVLELHTIPPQMAALNLGRTNVTAYDGTHGYSDQYIVELEVFLQAAREAGLEPVPEFMRRFPSSDLASISINLLRAREASSSA